LGTCYQLDYPLWYDVFDIMPQKYWPTDVPLVDRLGTMEGNHNITMQSLKFLTIQGNPILLTSFALPRLISLDLDASKLVQSPLSGYDIPHGLESLKINNIEIILEDVGLFKIFHTVCSFEAVDTIIVCQNEGRFSLPRVQSLHMERIRIKRPTDSYEFLDAFNVLDDHEAVGSVHSLHIIGTIITTAAIETLRKLKGLRKLAMISCYLRENSLDSFQEMLVPYNRCYIFPDLQFLHISGLRIHKGQSEFTRVDVDQLLTHVN
jgi:hypothetical protein